MTKYRDRLTIEYPIRNYRPVRDVMSGRLPNTEEDTRMSNDGLRYELARLDAKLDVIINYLMTQQTMGPSAQQASPSTQLSTGEIALMRSLTTKQHCALQLVERGLRNQDISDVLSVTENTVKLHVRAVCKKMGVKNRQQAATVAHDIYRSIDPVEYERLSGGIPLTWADTLSPDHADPYAPLYAPTRKDD